MLLLTKTRGGLLDGGAHRARDMVSWEEDGREKRRGVDVEVEKLFPERVRSVSRESAVCVLCGNASQGNDNKTSDQSILACLLPPDTHWTHSHFDDIIFHVHIESPKCIHKKKHNPRAIHTSPPIVNPIKNHNLHYQFPSRHQFFHSPSHSLGTHEQRRPL